MRALLIILLLLLPFLFFEFFTHAGTAIILSIALTITTSILLFQVIQLATKNKLYALLSVFLYATWNLIQISALPIMLCITLGILICYLLLKFYETSLERYLYLCGLTASVLFILNQNLGIMNLFVPIFFFFVVRSTQQLTAVLSFMYGFIWTTLLFAIYLLATGFFAPFANRLHKTINETVLIQLNFSTPFNTYDLVLLTTFLFLPFIMLFSTLVLLFIRRRYYLLHLPFFVLLFYIAGAYSMTNYLNLAPFISLLGIPSALFLRFNTLSSIRILLFLGTLGYVTLGLFMAMQSY